MAVLFRETFSDEYDERKIFIPFLSSFFLTLPRYIVRSTKIKIDVRRGSRKVAPVLSDMTARGGKIKKGVYTQKDFTPPVVSVGSNFSPDDLDKKAFGKTEEETALMEYMAQLFGLIMDDMTEIEKQFMRNIELQASQIFQTGILNLYDEKGNTAYILDFQMKATHKPTVGTSWSDPAADADGDISALIEVVQSDSDVVIENLVFGAGALTNYLKNTAVDKKFDNRRIISGEFKPESRNADVRFLGDILVGSEYVACWKYLGRYEDPADPTGSTVLKYVEGDKVLFLPNSDGINVDFRKYWAEVPRVTKNAPGYEDILPEMAVMSDRQFTPRIWENTTDDTLEIELKARPMLIPVSIDGYACLDTII